MAGSQDFFAPDQVAAIQEAVMAAELKTSGEIRVYIEKTTQEEDVLDRAANIFTELELKETKQRNGILFYLAVEDRKFAILGDKGINELTPDNFWDEIKNVMQEHFRNGKFTEGMVEGITLAGRALVNHFPYQRDDINELPNEVIFG